MQAHRLAGRTATRWEFATKAGVCGLHFSVQAAVLLVFVAAAAAQDKNDAKQAGDALYGKHCASCHDTGIARAPSRAALNHMSAENIRAALTTGSMSKQGADLSAAELDTVIRFLADL